MAETLPPPNVTAHDRVDAILAYHQKHAGLEGDQQIIFWQLLADMMEWCLEMGVNFDEILASVREEFEPMS